MSQALFQHLNKFISVEPQRFEEMLSFFTSEKFEKKEVLIYAGSQCDQLLFVEKGCLHSYFVDEGGDEKTIKFAIEGWWITDFLAFHHQRNTDFQTQAVEQSNVLSIGYNQYQQLLKQFPELEKYFRNVWEIAYGASLIRMKYVFEYSKEEMFNRFRKLFPEFVERVPQYMLATYLGLTPEYLSKIRGKKLS